MSQTRLQDFMEPKTTQLCSLLCSRGIPPYQAMAIAGFAQDAMNCANIRRYPPVTERDHKPITAGPERYEYVIISTSWSRTRGSRFIQDFQEELTPVFWEMDDTNKASLMVMSATSLQFNHTTADIFAKYPTRGGACIATNSRDDVNRQVQSSKMIMQTQIDDTELEMQMQPLRTPRYYDPDDRASTQGTENAEDGWLVVA